MVEELSVRVEQIMNNVPVMYSDQFTDGFEIPEQLQYSFRWLDTESFELRNKSLRFVIIIRIIAGKLIFLRKGYVAVCKAGF